MLGVASTADCRLLQRSCTCLMRTPDQPMLALSQERIMHNSSIAAQAHHRFVQCVEQYCAKCGSISSASKG